MHSPTQLLKFGPNYLPGIPCKVAACYYDIDNTLVSNDGAELPSAEFCRLARIVGKTIPVAVATARPLGRAIHILDAIDSKGISILSNGAVLYDGLRKQIIADYFVPIGVAAELAKKLQQNDFDYTIQDDVADYIWSSQAEARLHNAGHGMYRIPKDPFYPGGPKHTAAYYPKKPRIIAVRVHNSAQAGFINDLVKSYTNSNITSLLGHSIVSDEGKPIDKIFIVHKYANKKHALEQALKAQNVSAGQVLAVGDGPNDIEILKIVGISIAVANATPEVLQQAAFIAPSQEDDGAATTLRQLTITKDNNYILKMD